MGTTFPFNTTVVMKTAVCWDMTSHGVLVRSVEPLGSKAYQNNVTAKFLVISGKNLRCNYEPVTAVWGSYRCLGQLPLSGAVTAVWDSYRCLGQLLLFEAVTAVWGSYRCLG
jgi:hypothetical protein